ncbi:precorrin-3B synthase [Pseudomonas sp. dw_358]|uniref:precorrin-3B synthase n=1 Tax=Pseudomonas sp. dw_358 TaxID=2720083 RepID=UPI001BD1FFBF|nr:precorrin-3B synthase [Pseudomonas sp. dw_358]
MPPNKAGIIPRLAPSSFFSTISGDLLNEPASAFPPASSPRPSACPGLLRVVRARDGGLCRIKLPGGVLTAIQAEAIAAAAERYASGVIEVTNRSNLQLRGIGADAEKLAEQLLAAGLGPRHAAADDVRNLMLSPMADLDPQRLADTGPLAARILQSLEQRTALHQLSAKFAVQLDGGEALTMLGHHHDLWLSAMTLEGRVVWAVGLAGSPLDGSDVAVAFEDGHDLVMAVLERFVHLATPEQGRMRDLEQASRGLRGLLQESPVTFLAANFERTAACAEPLAVHSQSESGWVGVGAGAPLGRVDVSMLRGLARLARQYGDGRMRMTPWQGVLLTHVRREDAASLVEKLRDLGLLPDPAAPLAQLRACTGSAGCAKGLADTKADALRLAARLPVAQEVHLSGCTRSCACAHSAASTLLAVGEGFYDLYVRDASGEGFGTLQARHLSLDAAAARLGCSRSDTHD